MREIMSIPGKGLESFLFFVVSALHLGIFRSLKMVYLFFPRNS